MLQQWDESGSLPRPLQLFVQPPNFLRLTLSWQDKACTFNKGQSFQKLLVLHPYNMKRTMWSEPNQASLSKTHRTPAAVLQWTREHRGGADLAAARQNHAAGHKGSPWLFWNKSKVNKFERKISLQLACLACFLPPMMFIDPKRYEKNQRNQNSSKFQQFVLLQKLA